MKTIGTSERRRSRRYLPPAGLRLVVRRAGFLSFFSSDLLRRCLNISEGGLRVVLARAVEPGQRLHLRLDLGRGGEPLELRAQVTYAVTSGEHPDCFEAGLQFEDVAPADLARLREALRTRATPLTRRRSADDAWGGAR